MGREQSLFATREKILAAIRRRTHRGPFYRFSKYRRLPAIGPVRMSQYGNVWHRTRSARETIAWAEDNLGQGTWHGDLLDASEGNWNAALRLADQFMRSWNAHDDPRVWKELCEQARHEGKSLLTLKREALAFAVIHVRQRVDERQRVRLNSGYVRRPDGSVLWEVPNSTPARWVKAWLRTEVPKAAAAYLLGRPYPLTGRHRKDVLDSDQTHPLGPHGESDGIDAEIAAVESRMDSMQRVHAALLRAAPKQRELMEALLRAEGDIAEAAGLMSEPITDGHARQILFRLRNRLRGEI